MNRPVIVNLPIGNLLDIPGMLRRIADNMEKGEDEIPTNLIMVADCKDGDINVYGLGGYADTARIVGLLAMAQLRMAID